MLLGKEKGEQKCDMISNLHYMSLLKAGAFEWGLKNVSLWAKERRALLSEQHKQRVEMGAGAWFGEHRVSSVAERPNQTTGCSP